MSSGMKSPWGWWHFVFPTLTPLAIQNLFASPCRFQGQRAKQILGWWLSLAWTTANLPSQIGLLSFQEGCRRNAQRICDFITASRHICRSISIYKPVVSELNRNGVFQVLKLLSTSSKQNCCSSEARVVFTPIQKEDNEPNTMNQIQMNQRTWNLWQIMHAPIWY